MLPNFIEENYLEKLYKYNKVAKSLKLEWNLVNSKMSGNVLYDLIFDTQSIIDFIANEYGFFIGVYRVENEQSDNAFDYSYVTEITNSKGQQVVSASADTPLKISFIRFISEILSEDEEKLRKLEDDILDLQEFFESKFTQWQPKIFMTDESFKEMVNQLFDIKKSIDDNNLYFEYFDFEAMSITYKIEPSDKKSKQFILIDFDAENEIESVYLAEDKSKVNYYEICDTIVTMSFEMGKRDKFSLNLHGDFKVNSTYLNENGIYEIAIGDDYTVDHYITYLDKNNLTSELFEKNEYLQNLLFCSPKLFQHSDKLIQLIDAEIEDTEAIELTKKELKKVINEIKNTNKFKNVVRQYLDDMVGFDE